MSHEAPVAPPSSATPDGGKVHQPPDPMTARIEVNVENAQALHGQPAAKGIVQVAPSTSAIFPTLDALNHTHLRC